MLYTTKASAPVRHRTRAAHQTGREAQRPTL